MNERRKCSFEAVGLFSNFCSGKNAKGKKGASKAGPTFWRPFLPQAKTAAAPKTN